MKKTFILVAFATLAFGFTAQAQTNFQTFYDFGRKHFTTTLEGFHVDNWGNTFFFIDYDYNNRDASGKVMSPSGTYFEIARCFNFWQDSALAPISLQLEYNGGLATGSSIGASSAMVLGIPVNNAFLVGLDWFLHTKDFSSTLNFKVLYKRFTGLYSKIPMQFTTVWGCQDVFGIKGFRVSGFADFWCEGENLVFLSEPQLWFGFGDHFNVGGEVEFSYNFAGLEFTTGKKFNVMPCLGWKWVF